MKTFSLVLCFVLVCCLPAFAQPAGKIGYVQTLKGSATILRDGKTLSVAVGTLLYRNDSVRTAKGSALGIVLIDDTTISLGPGSELQLNEYNFDPKDGKLALVVKMVRGTFTYLSGLIGKLAPDAVKLNIPDATIATRGTKLLIAVEE